MLAKTEEATAGASAPATYQGIAVVGSNPITKMMAPYDGSHLVYACSPDNSPFGFSEHKKTLPRVDVWFEVHVPVFDRTRPYAYLEWLQTQPVVYMRDPVAMSLKDNDGNILFPNAIPYPEEEYKKPENFGSFHFTSSIAYQMAQAIMDCVKLRDEGVMPSVPTIGLYGIMQASKTEYTYQKPGIQHMIVEANKRRIKVVAPDVSMLFEPPPDDF